MDIRLYDPARSRLLCRICHLFANLQDQVPHSKVAQ
jgi:hypothetical protein